MVLDDDLLTWPRSTTNYWCWVKFAWIRRKWMTFEFPTCHISLHLLVVFTDPPQSFACHHFVLSAGPPFHYFCWLVSINVLRTSEANRGLFMIHVFRPWEVLRISFLNRTIYKLNLNLFIRLFQKFCSFQCHVLLQPHISINIYSAVSWYVLIDKEFCTLYIFSKF